MGTYYQRVALVLAAGESRPFPVYGSNLKLLSNTLSATYNPRIIIGSETEQEIEAGIGIELPDNEIFGNIRIKNPDPSNSMTLVFAISNGKVSDSRLVLSGGLTETNSAAILTALSNTAASWTTTLSNWVTALANFLSIISNTRSLNGDTGTQIVKSANVNNGTSTLYTVTTGKTLYITGFNGNINNQNTSSLNAVKLLYITDASDVEVCVLCRLISGGYTGVYQQVPAGQTFLKPIKVSAGYKIKTTSPAASDAYNAVSFQGWEE